MTKKLQPPLDVVRVVGAVAIALGVGGCTVTTTTRAYPVVADDTVVEAEFVPVDVYSRPRYYYGNRYVYLVDGRWYYPAHRGWAVYRREPVELQRQRVRYYDHYRTYRAPEYGYPRQPARRYYPY
jgi:hypothetical protein